MGNENQLCFLIIVITILILGFSITKIIEKSNEKFIIVEENIYEIKENSSVTPIDKNDFSEKWSSLFIVLAFLFIYIFIFYDFNQLSIDFSFVEVISYASICLLLSKPFNKYSENFFRKSIFAFIIMYIISLLFELTTLLSYLGVSTIFELLVVIGVTVELLFIFIRHFSYKHGDIIKMRNKKYVKSNGKYYLIK